MSIPVSERLNFCEPLFYGLIPAAIVRSTLKFRSSLSIIKPPQTPISISTDSINSDMYPGRDYKHRLVIMDNPGGIGATKQEIIDCYVKTLASITQRYGVQ